MVKLLDVHDLKVGSSDVARVYQGANLDYFDPRSLPNLKGWYDARYINGFAGAIPADGDAVSQWADLSGQGRHATQGTGAAQPKYRSTNRNLLTYNQATVENGTTGWGVLGNCTNARVTSQFLHGVACMSVTSGAAGDIRPQVGGTDGSTGAWAVVGSTQYTAVASFKSAVSARSCRIVLNWYTSGGAYISSSTGSSITDSTSGWTQATITATSPSNAAWCSMNPNVLAAGAGSEVHYIDCVGMWAGTSTTWTPPVTLATRGAAVQFDGSNDYLETASTGLVDGVSVYLVSSMDVVPAPAANDILVSGSPVTWTLSRDTGGHKMYAGTNLANATILTGAAAVMANIDNGVSSVVSVNGTLASGTAGGGINPTGQWRLGCLSGSSRFIYGSIMCFLTFNEVHSAGTRQLIERWLGRQYGITVA